MLAVLGPICFPFRTVAMTVDASVGLLLGATCVKNCHGHSPSATVITPCSLESWHRARATAGFLSELNRQFMCLALDIGRNAHETLHTFPLFAAAC